MQRVQARGSRRTATRRCCRANRSRMSRKSYAVLTRNAAPMRKLISSPASTWRMCPRRERVLHPEDRDAAPEQDDGEDDGARAARAARCRRAATSCELLRTKKYADEQDEEDHRLGRDQHDHAPPRGGVAAVDRRGLDRDDGNGGNDACVIGGPPRSARVHRISATAPTIDADDTDDRRFDEQADEEDRDADRDDEREVRRFAGSRACPAGSASSPSVTGISFSSAPSTPSARVARSGPGAATGSGCGSSHSGCRLLTTGDERRSCTRAAARSSPTRASRASHGSARRGLAAELAPDEVPERQQRAEREHERGDADRRG